MPTKHSPKQTLLNINLRDGFRFESFYADEKSKNREVVSMLSAFVTSSESQQNMLWGDAQTGKTHLLQACCAKAAETHNAISYIPLKAVKDYGIDVLNGLSQSYLIVIDDVDEVIGDKSWETALFNLINLSRENKQHLLISSRQNPRKLACVLPDLASRLIWGGSYQLHALNDDDTFRMLQARADHRGIVLHNDVISYIYRRYPRDIKSLLEILDKLDEESLRQQKPVITVPFVKQVLS